MRCRIEAAWMVSRIRGCGGGIAPYTPNLRGGSAETYFEKEHNSVNANGVFQHHSMLFSSISIFQERRVPNEGWRAITSL